MMLNANGQPAKLKRNLACEKRFQSWPSSPRRGGGNRPNPSANKNGVAAKELERQLGVTYKTAFRTERTF